MRRERLFDRLDRGVRAPADAARRAARARARRCCSASWIAAGRAGPVAWLSLDASDGERRRFWRAVLEALHRASGRAGRPAARAVRRPRRAYWSPRSTAALPGRRQPRWCSCSTTSTRSPARSTPTSSCCCAIRCPGCGWSSPAAPTRRCTSGDCACRTSSRRSARPTSPSRSPRPARCWPRSASRSSDDDVRRLWAHTEGWVGAIRLAAMSLRDHPTRRASSPTSRATTARSATTCCRR